MKDIYVVLIKANTGLGKILRKFSRYEYTHIAVSLDASLTDFITFSRRKHYLPLDAGFMHEYRDYYAFGKNKKVKIKVFKLPVNDENYNNILDFIQKIEMDKEYIFNLFSMMTMPIIHGFEIYKTYNCMSFTSKIIELTNIVALEKPYFKYSIKDIDKRLTKFECFEGYLVRRTSSNYDTYMKKQNLFTIISSGAITLYVLTKRFFCK